MITEQMVADYIKQSDKVKQYLDKRTRSLRKQLKDLYWKNQVLRYHTYACKKGIKSDKL